MTLVADSERCCARARISSSKLASRGRALRWTTRRTRPGRTSTRLTAARSATVGDTLRAFLVGVTADSDGLVAVCLPAGPTSLGSLVTVSISYPTVWPPDMRQGTRSPHVTVGDRIHAMMAYVSFSYGDSSLRTDFVASRQPYI